MILASYFGEMNFGWWFLWLVLIIWMLVTAFEIPILIKKVRSTRRMIDKGIRAKEKMLKKYYE